MSKETSGNQARWIGNLRRLNCFNPTCGQFFLAATLFLTIAGFGVADAKQRDVVIFADFACTNIAAGDPDDCLAVEALRRMKETNILAVVASGGNSSPELSLELGAEKFPDLRIFPGSRPRSRYIHRTYGKLAELIVSQNNSVTLLVLSPATDLANLASQHPGAFNYLEEVVFVAGRSPGDIFRMKSVGRTIRDMNYEKDREAFFYLLKLLHNKRIRTTFVGFRAAMNTAVPEKFFPRGFVPRAQRAWARKTRFWFGQSLPPFDLVAAMSVTAYRNKLRCEKVSIRAGSQLELRTARRSAFRFCE